MGQLGQKARRAAREGGGELGHGKLAEPYGAMGQRWREVSWARRPAGLVRRNKGKRIFLL